MKKIIITAVIILIAITSAYSQSLKDISSEKFFLPIEKNDSKTSLRLKPVFTSITNSSGYNYDLGYGFTTSLQIDLGKMVSLLGEVSFSWFSYNSKSAPPRNISGTMNSKMINVGIIFYPDKSFASPYIKAGTGLMSKHNEAAVSPLINVGIGIDYNVSKIFKMFSEIELNIRNETVVSGESTDFSFGIGLSLILNNL